MIKRIEKLLFVISFENKPQINADKRRFNESVSIEKDCLGVSTHGVAMRVRGVENPQGFGIDERRFNESVSMKRGCQGLRF
ncbi:Uncharacterised protein [uncultured archaeon]|nr:Uncharacterised protein [uncultured archaeon]